MGTTQAALVRNTDGGSSYVTECFNDGVPTPPPWGSANIGTAPGKWTLRGSYTDPFLVPDLIGTIYTTNSSSPPGMCLINAHGDGTSPSLFDIICQGTNGRACFWEGTQPGGLPINPTNIPLVPNGSWTQGGTPIAGGGGPGSPTGGCPNCHAGQNAFITHYSAQHPLNQTNLSAWMLLAGAYDPIGPASGSSELGGVVPGREPFTNYPLSSSKCLSCHSGAAGSPGAPAGGAFPLLSTPEFAGNYCDVLAHVTNLPASLGGMPPTGNCTPDVNCAAQRDPFVQQMLSECNTTYNSPTNLALNKVATVSSDYLNIGADSNGSRATDGNLNQTWAGGSIATTLNNTFDILDSAQAEGTPGTWQYTTGVLQNSFGSLVANGSTAFGIGPFGSNAYGPVYKYNFPGNYWTSTNGSLTSISLGADRTLWGINPNATYLYRVGDAGWTQVSSWLFSQISAGDGVHAWGIDTAGTNIFRFSSADGPYAVPVEMLSGTWPGKVAGATLTRIAVGSDDDAWAIDSNGNLIHYAGGGNWALANPLFQGTTSTVSALAVTNAQNVWVNSGNLWGIFNYYPSTNNWQNHCPPYPAPCPQFNAISISPQENAVWALAADGPSTLYQVDHSQVANQNNQFSTVGSLVSTGPGLYYAQIAAGGYGMVYGTNATQGPNSGYNFMQVGYNGEQPLPGGAYWMVDLGGYYNVTQVKIYNYSDGPGFLSHFRINYYNSGSSAGAWVVGSDQSNTIMSSSNLILPIDVNFYTQYVMIQKTDRNYLTLAEVQVFGTPATQY